MKEEEKGQASKQEGRAIIHRETRTDRAEEGKERVSMCSGFRQSPRKSSI
jgi:hypothetical protein